MAKVTKDTIIGDILTIESDVTYLLADIGMHCLGCPASRAETLEGACAAHGVDLDEMLDKINNLIESKHSASVE